MQTITTKYLSARRYTSARVIARASGSGHTAVWMCESDNVTDDHCNAAKLLAQKLDWKGEMVGGHLKNEQEMIWVFTAPLSPRFVL